MKRTLFPLTVLSSLLMSACGLVFIPGSGKIASTNRSVSGFDQVVFSVPGELTIVQDGSESLKIEGDDNLLGHIQTSVVNGILHIDLEPGIAGLAPSRPILYSLSVKSLKSLKLDGSGNIRAASLEGDRFGLDLDGSGNVVLGNVKVNELIFNLDGSGTLDLKTLSAKNVTLTLNGSGGASIANLSAEGLVSAIDGSGHFTLNGKVARETLQINGSGNYDARGLQSQQAQVSINGSGDGRVWVTDKLEVFITGSGGLAYQGSPKISQQVTGSGSIYPIE